MSGLPVRNRQDSLSAQNTFSKVLTMRAGGILTLSGTWSATVSLYRIGSDGNRVAVTGNTGTPVTFTANGTYTISPSNVAAQYQWGYRYRQLHQRHCRWYARRPIMSTNGPCPVAGADIVSQFPPGNPGQPALVYWDTATKRYIDIGIGTNLSVVGGNLVAAGGGSPQTPWASDINGAGHGLTNAANISVNGDITAGGVLADTAFANSIDLNNRVFYGLILPMMNK